MASYCQMLNVTLKRTIQIVALASVAACMDLSLDLMPVPLGDPEKSQVDPWFNGLWLGDESIYVFEPYDKRTWLVTLYWIDDSDCAEADDPGASDSDSENQPITDESDDAFESAEEESEDPSYASLIADLRARGSDCLSGEPDGSMKVWMTKIAEADYMTWEYKGGFSADTGFMPQYWAATRVLKLEHGDLALNLIDPHFDGFFAPNVKTRLDKLDSEIPREARTLAKARRAVERVIRKNTDNDDLYYGEYNEDSPSLFRIQPQDYDLFVGGVVPVP